MKSIIRVLFITIFLLISTIAHAGFNWGVGTYENYDDILIINSLGDSVSPSTFGNLGVNDFIGENGVKNYLALEGYTSAKDYNPLITNPQFVDYYNDVPPSGYKKLSYAGLLGDPRQVQDVYVLQSEWDALSAKNQDTRINAEATTRTTNDNVLHDNINTVDNNSIVRDNILQSDINNEIVNRISSDNILQDNIDTVNNDSVERDDILQSNINSEATTRYNADKALSDKNNQQDTRIKKLEDTQYEITGEARVVDSRKVSIAVYSTYSTTRNTVTNAGVRVTFKLGRSYEENRINQLEAKINKLLKAQQIIEENNVQVISDGTGLRVVNKF